jgi:general secretion pathway protein C
MARWAGLARKWEPMELAKNLAQWRDRSPEQWIAQANRYLPPIAVGVLVLLIAFKAADLTWRLLESPSAQDEVPPTVRLTMTTDNATAGPASYETLADWQPFGRAPDESAVEIPAEIVLDAPDTTLNLTLVGTTVAQTLPEPGTTVIIHEKGSAVLMTGRGEQKTYRKGETIENVGNATLHSIFTDRVLLDRGGGRLEALRYPEMAGASSAGSRVAATRPQLTGIRQPESLGAAVSIADAASEAASLIGEHMQVAMHTENGQAIGFRVQPRGDGRVFAQLGLEPGDILTQVNGIPLSDARNAPQVLAVLGETQQASVMIRRNGSDQALTLNVGDIQRLAESLQ